jgi:ABC-type phosphate/phosphonate transport system substrate-binding protein
MLLTVDDVSRKSFGKEFAQLTAKDQREFIDRMRQNKIEGWTGKPAGLAYAVLRADAVDVVYGTVEGYEALGIPYMPHIPPEKRW